ncbi:MAG TPA: alkaline phosphatase family protein [Candidatus Cybelea sp.]|nr:alkaline phosphatase family protein [Candidatus Cybelea sp.]
MRGLPTAIRILSVAFFALLFSACNGSGGVSPVPQGAQTFVGRTHHHSSSGKIQHVIIIVQENRSFNNLFYGFPHAKTAKYGYNTSGQKIVLQPVGLETSWDIEHQLGGFLAACNGTGSLPGTDCQMNGFDNEYWGCSSCPNANPPYSYVPHSETKPYFYMGRHYVLADEMFASNLDASSFISHQYIIAGQASSAVNFPSGWWGCPGVYSGDYIYTITSERQYGSTIPMCFSNTTLGDEMDSAGLSWAFYTSTYYGDGGIWSAYQNIKQIYDGPDWAKDVITPQTNFFSDVSNGKLRDLTWITPTCENSDHAGCGSKTGPSWVASLVNAIGDSQYWDNTAIFIMWDDYGGWFDPVPPKMLDYDGLGIRIPMLIVSAYAKKGYVSHTHYEHGSILKFAEETFGLAPLAASDTRATAPDDAFDFNAPPRKFETVPAEHGIKFFMHQKLDHRIPDAE